MWTRSTCRRLPGCQLGGAFFLMLLLIPITSGTSHSASPGWKPERNVEIIVPSAAGGGADRTGRVIQKVLQDKRMLDVSSSVMNKPGGGGAVGWAYLNQHPGDGHYLALSSPTLLTNRITGSNPLSYTDLTPIVQLFSEYLAVAVKTESSIKGAKELLERLMAEPGSLTIAIGTAPGGANHIGVALAAKGAGVDIRKLKIVVFKTGSESLTALLGGHVDVVASSPANIRKLYEAKQIRVLAVAAPKRLRGAFADVPTWSEHGIDAVFANWRCLMGPRGMNQAQVTYWEDVFSKLVKTDDWKKDLETNHWDGNFLNSEASKKFIEAQNEVASRTLVELGLAKQ